MVLVLTDIKEDMASYLPKIADFYLSHPHLAPLFRIEFEFRQDAWQWHQKTKIRAWAIACRVGVALFA